MVFGPDLLFAVILRAKIEGGFFSILFQFVLLYSGLIVEQQERVSWLSLEICHL